MPEQVSNLLRNVSLPAVRLNLEFLGTVSEQVACLPAGRGYLLRL